MRVAAVLALAIAMTPPAAARTSLGTFEGWGAFRDEHPPRCFAIAEPVRPRKGPWRPFASVANWPEARVRGQLQVRFSQEKSGAAAVTLAIGNRRFALVGAGADAWSADPRADAAIAAAMRSASSMTIRTRATSGSAMSDTYALRGAATAMDAAALGCARR